MKIEMEEMFKRCQENFSVQFQSMQSYYQTQISQLQTNMDGFNALSNFMVRSGGDGTPTNFGFGSFAHSSANQGFGFGRRIHPTTGDIDYSRGSRGRDGHGPSSINTAPIANQELSRGYRRGGGDGSSSSSQNVSRHQSVDQDDDSRSESVDD